MISTTLLSFLPVALVLLVVEAIYAWKEDRDLYTFRDTICNILIGVIHLICIAVSRVSLYTILVFVSRWQFFSLGNSWYAWLLGFLLGDLTFYWYHRCAHEINWLWASHAVHHSSQKLNMSTSFRQSWTTNFSGHIIFWAWIPLAGFQPAMILLVSQVILFYQYLLHTEAVRKLPGWIEYVFNTPSHHRVHHSSNPKYLDKNHGGILIIWDRLFSTYCEENEQPVYGLTDKLESDNPFVVVFSAWKDILRKAAHAGSLKRSLNYFIKAPGWSHDGSSMTVKQMRRPVPSVSEAQ